MYSSPRTSFVSSCFSFHSISIFATDFGRKTFRTLLSVFGVFKTRTVLLVLLFSGNISSTSFASSSFKADLLTRWDSLLINRYARFSSIASSEMSTQSQVSPRSSLIRREQEKERFIASFNRSSSHTSSAYIRVSAVQISRFFVLCFGTVA